MLIGNTIRFLRLIGAKEFRNKEWSARSFCAFPDNIECRADGAIRILQSSIQGRAAQARTIGLLRTWDQGFIACETRASLFP
jgi:hypothetical protein